MAALVSIVIPTFNRAALLARALRSVMKQTYTHWECLIVDDGSTEDIRAAVAAIAPFSDRVQVIRLDQRHGATIARAIGCERARGRYLAPLDSDDWWHAQKLELQVAAMEAELASADTTIATSPVLSLHAVEVVSAEGTNFIDHVHPRENFLRDILRDNFAAHGSFLMRRDAYLAVGGYDRRLRYSEDWDLLLRLVLNYGVERIVPLPEVLAYWWKHDQNISADGSGVLRSQREVVLRTIVTRGLLIRHPRLALEMLDRQLDREMHSMAWRQPKRACLAAALSALSRPYRLWRWQRVLQFARRPAQT